MPPAKNPRTPVWVAVELSNYPPQLARGDVEELFKNFTISPDFLLPNTMRLAYPLRTFIRVAGKQEAERAVKELTGKVVAGRRIYVVLVDEVSYEQKEVIVAELAEELKIGIMSTYMVLSSRYQTNKRQILHAYISRILPPSFLKFASTFKELQASPFCKLVIRS